MPYDLKIRDVDTQETYETTLEELKELREILLKFENKNIEVDLINKKKVKKR